MDTSAKTASSLPTKRISFLLLEMVRLGLNAVLATNGCTLRVAGNVDRKVEESAVTALTHQNPHYGHPLPLAFL
jgi:hypothetical protein